MNAFLMATKCHHKDEFQTAGVLDLSAQGPHWLKRSVLFSDTIIDSVNLRSNGDFSVGFKNGLKVFRVKIVVR